jgi:hypothetical protein|tara:strand:- start:3564 stop:3701 length:138 start_codon:yes stop_codon:yes gene_type:complete
MTQEQVPSLVVTEAMIGSFIGVRWGNNMHEKASNLGFFDLKLRGC